MKLGDILYCINCDYEILEWRITKIDELDDIKASIVLDLSLCSDPEDTAQLYYDLVNYPQGLWYSDKEVAKKYRDEMYNKHKEELNEARQQWLEDALNSVFIDEVVKKGVVLSTRYKYSKNHHDKAILYEYENKQYIAVFRCTKNRKRCVLFKERGTGYPFIK